MLSYMSSLSNLLPERCNCKEMGPNVLPGYPCFLTYFDLVQELERR